MNNFDTELKERTAYVEKIVYDYCPKEEGLQKIIIEAMNYSLKAGGKRLRPMLVLETLRLFGGDEKEADTSGRAAWDLRDPGKISL